MFLSKLVTLTLCLQSVRESNANQKYVWKSIKSVSNQELARRPDGAWISPRINDYAQVYVAKVWLNGHYSIGNYRPAAMGYGMWYMRLLGGVTHQVLLGYDEDVYKIDILITEMDTLSWVYDEGRLQPYVTNLIIIGQYEDGNWIVPCRAFNKPSILDSQQKPLVVGAYFMKEKSGSGYQSEACMVLRDGGLHSFYEYEILRENLLLP